MVQQMVVKVFTSKESVSVSGLNLEDSFLNLEDGDIECASSQIKDSDDFVLRFVQTIGKGSGCGLIDNLYKNNDRDEKDN